MRFRCSASEVPAGIREGAERLQREESAFALGERARRAVAGRAAAVAASKITGKKSRANPVASGVTSAAGSIATDLAGPIVGRFVRNLLGGLMR